MTTTLRKGTTRHTRPRVEAARRGPDGNSFLIGSVAVLCLFGLAMVYSASMVYAPGAKTGPGWRTPAIQAGYMAIGALGAFVASRLPERFWRSGTVTVLISSSFVFQGYLVIARLVSLVGLKVPFAVKVNGAYRWIGHAPISFQPSDLAKLALILWVAREISNARGNLDSPDVLKRILVVSGSLCALVLAGNDLGTTILLFGTTFVMLFLAGVRWSILLRIAAVGLLVVALAMTFLGGFRMERVSAFLDPGSNDAKSYQAHQSKIGFASGGYLGAGPGNSRLKWGYLPEADTDFIFAVVGEELGVIGTVVILGAYLTFVGAAVVIATRCKRRFGKLVTVGVATWIGVQAIINIGVALSVLPTKGITLPFVSRGGSSLMMCLLAVGVVLSVTREPA